MLSLSELIETFRIYNLSPKKYLGQHFLIDKNIQKKIILNCQLSSEDIILEIGPGLGALTEEICKHVKFVYAVEKDKIFCELLKNRLNSFQNFKIINSDILQFDFSSLGFLKEKLKVIGNIPYYISTPILTHLIKNYKYINIIYVTLQKELSQRIMAKSGDKEYSSLSIFIHSYAKPEILFTIKKNSFYPPPKVDSSFMKIKILSKPRVNNKLKEKFFLIVHSAFQRRRKTILNALSGSRLGLERKEWKEILEKLRIDPQRRPETLDIEEFINLAKCFQEYERSKTHIDD